MATTSSGSSFPTQHAHKWLPQVSQKVPFFFILIIVLATLADQASLPVFSIQDYYDLSYV